MRSPSISEHLRSIMALPFIVTVIIPATLYFLTIHMAFNPVADHLNKNISYFLGFLLLITGIPLFVRAVILFHKIGKGTLAPWNPAKKLIIKSLYRHMRNPMITGVCFILLGEAFILRSTAILIWSLVFISTKHAYFVFKEEPELLKRFGEEYSVYKKNVPRWIPRIKGWKPENE